MKKISAIIFVCFIFITGCTELSTNNPYFYSDDSSKVYKGTFSFDDVNIDDKDITLNIKLLDDIKGGRLYDLKLDKVDGVPDDRLYLGCFLVMKDKIYKINPTENNLNSIKQNNKLPDDSVLVCQEKEMKDPLDENEAGWHQYMEVKGNQKIYHSYNNQVETGFYETFIWEKGNGLIKYRSGFGAERDHINLELSSYSSNNGTISSNPSISREDAENIVKDYCADALTENASVSSDEKNDLIIDNKKYYEVVVDSGSAYYDVFYVASESGNLYPQYLKRDKKVSNLDKTQTSMEERLGKYAIDPATFARIFLLKDDYIVGDIIRAYGGGIGLSSGVFTAVLKNGKYKFTMIDGFESQYVGEITVEADKIMMNVHATVSKPYAALDDGKVELYKVPSNYKFYKGKISDNLSITMKLKYTNKSNGDKIVEGEYFYDKIKKPLVLHGILSGNGELELFEQAFEVGGENLYYDSTGYFHGVEDGDIIQGQWVSPDGKKQFPFILTKEK